MEIGDAIRCVEKQMAGGAHKSGTLPPRISQDSDSPDAARPVTIVSRLHRAAHGTSVEAAVPMRTGHARGSFVAQHSLISAAAQCKLDQHILFYPQVLSIPLEFCSKCHRQLSSPRMRTYPHIISLTYNSLLFEHRRHAQCTYSILCTCSILVCINSHTTCRGRITRCVWCTRC